jgi:hypothetical protein
MCITAQSLHCNHPPAAKPLGGWNHLTPCSSAVVPAMAVRVSNCTALFQVARFLNIPVPFISLRFI